MRKAFTLAEVLIVIVIIGVLAAVSIPSFRSLAAKARDDQAIVYLKAIRAGEKIYRASGGTYVECADAASIKAILGVEVTEGDFTFSVGKGATNDIATSFIAYANRKNVPQPPYGWAREWISINQDGFIDRGAESFMTGEPPSNPPQAEE